MSFEILDNYADVVRVTICDHDIVLEVENGEAELTSAAAAQIADALYEAAGRQAVGIKSSVNAAGVSFNEGLLRLAAINDVEVSFTYAKGDGSIIEQRRLVPGEVKEIRDHLTFLGYDPDRDDVRAFRVDRIRGQVSV